MRQAEVVAVCRDRLQTPVWMGPATPPCRQAVAEGHSVRDDIATALGDTRISNPVAPSGWNRRPTRSKEHTDPPEAETLVFPPLAGHPSATKLCGLALQ